MKLVNRIESALYDSDFASWVGIVCLFICALIVVAIIVGGVMAFVTRGHEKITLNANAWQCTVAVEKTSTTYIMQNKVLVPLTTTYKECVQWTSTAESAVTTK